MPDGREPNACLRGVGFLDEWNLFSSGKTGSRRLEQSRDSLPLGVAHGRLFSVEELPSVSFCLCCTSSEKCIFLSFFYFVIIMELNIRQSPSIVIYPEYKTLIFTFPVSQLAVKHSS